MLPKKGVISLSKTIKIRKPSLFLDLVSYEDLAILYSNALCYLSCSYDEMMGTTSSNLPVKEALACGYPQLFVLISLLKMWKMDEWLFS
jgi:glycosyltransferase involved in cell wall biosynthesis